MADSGPKPEDVPTFSEGAPTVAARPTTIGRYRVVRLIAEGFVNPGACRVPTHRRSRP